MAIAINGVNQRSGRGCRQSDDSFPQHGRARRHEPYVVNASVAANQYVGTNAAFAMQFNERWIPVA